jgi:2,5-diketo-D-gluconate reductase A|tara:strand:- start:220 stop:1209 length:990 start_codon:yes stop_codon:yes gene_type:complete
MSLLLINLAVVWSTPATVPSVALGPNLTMPAVSLGTGEYQGNACVAAVSSAISLGYRSIDTAHEYGNQKQVGAAVRAAIAANSSLARSDFFIITKVEGGLSPDETTKHLEADVALLDLGSTLDLVLLHYPKAAPFKSLEATIQEQWRAIVAFADAGNARAVGVSQFCAACLKYLDEAGATGQHARPRLHQFGWHVGMGRDPQGIAAVTAARGDCVAMAYSPLAEADPAIFDGAIAAIGKAHGVESTQVALRWLWQMELSGAQSTTHSQAHIPFAVAASNPVYQASNLDIFGTLQLTASEMDTLSDLTKPRGCPFWQGSECYTSSNCTKV